MPADDVGFDIQHHAHGVEAGVVAEEPVLRIAAVGQNRAQRLGGDGIRVGVRTVRRIDLEIVDRAQEDLTSENRLGRTGVDGAGRCDVTVQPGAGAANRESVLRCHV